MMDTKYLTNQRRKQEGNSVFRDSRDWSGGNNDWQVQSLRDAEAAGWEFVGAVGEPEYPVPGKGGQRRRASEPFGGPEDRLRLWRNGGLAGDLRPDRGIIGGLVGFFLG